jgi:dTDP-4-dehydrorhamnose 3,5-epimerase
MRFEPTRLEGFVAIELDLHTDERGSFARTFCVEEFRAAGIPFEVVQANLSLNPQLHTLRGMHFQEPPHEEPKVVLCANGRIFDVAVDLRSGSPTYLMWDALELGVAGGTARCAYLAPGLAHGFLTLEPDSDVFYLMGAPYVPGSARGVPWNDPEIGIEWPALPKVISQKDAAYPPIGRG